MYVLIVGAGKVGWNLARELIEKGNEVTVVESDPRRYETVEEELEHSVQYGDGSELWVLERAGIERADLVIAVTGDDEDNILICQVAREKYGVERVVARCNNPRNLQHFELLGRQAGGVGHRPDPAPDRARGAQVRPGAPARPARRSGSRSSSSRWPRARRPPASRCADLGLPDGSLVISILRDGGGFVPAGDSVDPGRRRGAARARHRPRGRRDRALRQRAAPEAA